MTKKIDFPYWAAVAVCLCALLLLLRWFALPLLAAALPFLLAATLALLLDPLAKRLARALHWKRAVCAVLLFLLAVGLVLFSGGFAVAVLIRQGRALLAGWLADLGSPSSLLSNAIDALRLPAGEESALFRAHLKTMLNDFANRLLGEIAGQFPGIAAKIAAGIPSAILFFVVTVFSGVFFSANGGQFGEQILDRLPKARRAAFCKRRKQICVLLQKYVRAYLVLFLITFVILLCGFWALGVRYAFLGALLVALVDLLPFFGVGTALIPWAIVELLCGQYYLGFGLLILCLAATVARQIAEPHLVGKTLGVHPLLSLAAAYAGWKLAGVPGLVAGPLLLPILRRLAGFFEAGAEKND